MRAFVAALILCLIGASASQAQGLLVPTQRSVPPLALSSHDVHVTIEDQAAVTRVVQTFKNPTSQALEATYVFPVPKGASVKNFTMWVGGKEVRGELVDADKARAIYTDIVRRTQDPGLLEYLGNNLMQVRVFPVPAHGEQKLSVSYTSLASSDSGLVEYVYPLKKTAAGVEHFTLEATLKGQQPIQSVYSPTHAVTVRRPSDRVAIVRFEGKQGPLDKDFQLYYTAAAKDIGLTALVHRPQPGVDGHFMMLISPRAELSRTQQAPRDMIFVLDTSGSMAGKRIVQARNALKYCLRNLNAKDHFGMIHFATSVTKYQEGLLPGTSDQVAAAQSWVDNLEATGSTNIDEALAAALAMRSADDGRTLTIVFFTDGQPTIGETDPQRIVQNVVAKNTANTRIFTFGVGDDVNAVLLDQLAEKTRSISTYVRESEDIEAKVSGLYAKISHPVLTNLKLTVGANATISEMYPPQLPDLFHGGQIVVLGRYKPVVPTGAIKLVAGAFQAVIGVSGPIESAGLEQVERTATQVKLTGMLGSQSKEFTYEVHFAHKTGKDKAFVEDLWARRKVGYLLDQIRTHGENKELKDEVIVLAKKYGITTPYTSYLVVPDVAPATAGNYWSHGYNVGGGYSSGVAPLPAADSPTGATSGSGRIQFAPVFVTPQMQWGVPNSNLSTAAVGPTSAPASLAVPAMMLPAPSPQSGKEGVDLALQLNEMRNQDVVKADTARQVAGRNCLNINGVWTDEGVDAKRPVVAIKAQSEAYFRMLERHPELRELFQLGNRIAWVTPSQTVLVIAPTAGEERLSDADIDRLFVKK